MMLKIASPLLAMVVLATGATAQTTPAPTVDPLAPTTSPTASPTKSPSTSPTASPSKSPTVSPTPPPSKSPTVSPTKSPSASPTSAAQGISSTATAPSPTNSMTGQPVQFNGTATIEGLGCTVGGDNSALEPTIEAGMDATICDEAFPTADCSNDVFNLQCANGRRELSSSENGNLRHRALQTTDLTFEFTTIIEVYCQTNDCSDATSVVNGVSDYIEEVFEESIISGDFEADLQAAAASAGQSSAFANIDIGTPTFSTVVLPEVFTLLIETLGTFYPDWSGGTTTCLNDGNAPLYMKRNGGFLKSSLEDCCTAYYSWEKTKCLQLGGASTSEFASDEYYVNYYSESCEQDCLEDSDATKNCGGLVPSWKTLFATAEDCCESKLFWVEQSSCIADSTLTPATAPAGSGKWYRKGENCVKDCETSSTDAECGGLAERWDDASYDTGAACCTAKVWWREVSDCLS